MSKVPENLNLSRDRIVAVGLLTQADLIRLGGTFKRLWPVQDAPDFEELLKAIDDADAGTDQGGRS